MAPTNSAHGVTWDLGIRSVNPDDPEIAADPRLTSALPATRLSTEGVAARARDLTPEGANLVEQLMTSAVYSTLSRSEAGLITNGVVGDIVFGDQRPDEGMQAIADRLRAEDSA